MGSRSGSPTRPDAWGPPTDWALVAGASLARSGPDAERSWRGLLERYRHPVELSVRRRLPPGASASELVDSFFSYLYTEDVLARVDRERGRFRCFLQVVLRRFLARVARSERRNVPLEWEVPVVETPEIERQEEADWATAVLRNAVEELRSKSPRGAELLLRVHGVPPWPRASTEALCAEYDLNANALYQAVHRARRRLRELVLTEIRNTVLTEQDYVLEKKLMVDRLLEAYGRVFVEES